MRRGQVVGFWTGAPGVTALVLAASIAASLAVASPAIGRDVERRRPRQPVHFTDVTARAGVDYLQHALREPPDCIFFGGSFCEPERMSGGAAVGDVDGDGHTDLLVTRLDAPDILFRNLGNGRFEDASEVSGLADFDLQSNGAAFADIDGDGDLDLYVSVLGSRGEPPNDRNHLFLNDGSGHFVEAALERGVAVQSPYDHRGYGVAFGDYDRDGWVDLHVNEWFPGFEPHSRLFRNRGPEAPGYFEDVTEAAGVRLDGVFAFASAFADLDDDGWPDLAVAADFGTGRLFWNQGDGTFLDGTEAAGVGTDENGMGSTFGDYDGDGDLDWFVTSIYDPADSCSDGSCNWGATGNRLYRNEGGRVFHDATDEAGVRDGAWGWGAGFFDYDNDGDLDLAMTNGVEFPGTDLDRPFTTDTVRLWRNDGDGPMEEIAARAGVDDPGSGKGLLVFDYDADGDQDLFLVNTGAGPRLYRNDGRRGRRARWLRVEARGAGGNSEGLGALVYLFSRRGMQLREIDSATHFLGQSERVAHFGLGAGPPRVPLVLVRWPSGTLQPFFRVRTNRTLVAVEPAACGLIGLEAAIPGALSWALCRRRGRTRSQRDTPADSP